MHPGPARHIHCSHSDLHRWIALFLVFVMSGSRGEGLIGYHTSGVSQTFGVQQCQTKA